MFLIFDTETTGLPKNWSAPITDSDNWPRLVQLAWQVHDDMGDLIDVKNYIVKPEGFVVPFDASRVHGITTEKAQAEGEDLEFVLKEFNAAAENSRFLIGHNVEFDINILGAEYHRKELESALFNRQHICTKDESTDFCAIPGGRGGKFKWPKLNELHEKLFNEDFDEAHNASADVEATARCFLELVRLNVIGINQLKLDQDIIDKFRLKHTEVIKPAGIEIKSNKSENEVKNEEVPEKEIVSEKPAEENIAEKIPETAPENNEPEQSDEEIPEEITEEQKQEETQDNVSEEQVEEEEIDPEEIAEVEEIVQQESDESPENGEVIPEEFEETEEEIAEEIIEKEEKPEAPQVDSYNGFTHLHVHSQFSLLDGAADISRLIEKVKNDDMKAVAVTDHGNMFGAKLFHKLATKAGIKPILGCEVYIAKRSRHNKEKIDSSSNHLVLLAKNKTGYNNLIKMVSYAWLEGMYYRPRIDRELLKKYHEGIIACSACLNGELAQAIQKEGPEVAERIINDYKTFFGDDYYLEMQRHQSGDPKMDSEVFERQEYVNKTILELAKRFDVKYIATNDVHFINEDDAAAHDRLICISTASNVADEDRLHYTKQEWLKTQQEMKDLYADVPEAITNTIEIYNKIEEYELDCDPIMPHFEIPDDFNDQDEYLKHISYEGAKMRWGELTDDITERLDFELETIKKMGFPGYFLIVWDFLKEARNMGVSVGPGRGSAAGSVVAYCLRITEIDPIKYNLLFERFLNPDRISMPDIDIDFDDEGRSKVLDYVTKKYGEKRVAHIITFGSMAAKSAIRDVARVQQLPLSEADKLAKLVPESPGITLEKAYKEVPELKTLKTDGAPEVASVLKFAEILEGSMRNTGVHACGVIIGKDDLENFIPISTAKDSELRYVTQYDGKHVEDIGLLKMDFLGLKTLSIIKEAINNIKLSKGIDIDIDNVPLDDEKTYELYSKGETTALFQFESDGMKKHLKELKPTKFEDLIAMNALYRPGPMEYIPDFIARKHGRLNIKYDFPIMEEVLKETYGITVYQEQVMLLSRIMAGFTRGQADSLRKAMGKKIMSMMNDLKPKFIAGCKEKHGFEEDQVIKVWKDWEKFAEYAFNKSHATCYSYISFQTAYLKAHYPSEFMAGVLSNNLSDIKKITFFMSECRRMGMNVLGPDVNESHTKFAVNKDGHLRFGMVAIKGVGGAAAENIIETREKGGPFKSIFDFIERVNLKSVNKKSIEALAVAGAFDLFEEIDRYQFFIEENNTTFVEKLVSYGNKLQTGNNSTEMTLFEQSSEYDNAIEKPKIPEGKAWDTLETLSKEKELIGIYLSAHPLDKFRFEIENLNVTPLSKLKNLHELKGKDIMIAGLVTSAQERMTKNGNPFGSMTIEDYTDSYRLVQFSKDYLQFKSFFQTNYSIMIKGKVVEKTWPKDAVEKELEFKISNISMLANVKEEFIKSILLKIPLENVSDGFIKELKGKYDKNNGTVLLKFAIYDSTEQLSVEMFSRNKGIDLSEEIIEYLENNSDIEYEVKINR